MLKKQMAIFMSLNRFSCIFVSKETVGRLWWWMQSWCRQQNEAKCTKFCMVSKILVIHGTQCSDQVIEWFRYRSPLHCSALLCTALIWPALHCTALSCNAVHCTALHLYVLLSTALLSTALLSTDLLCSILHWCALQCSALHSTALHSIVLPCTALQRTECRFVRGHIWNILLGSEKSIDKVFPSLVAICDDILALGLNLYTDHESKDIWSWWDI